MKKHLWLCLFALGAASAATPLETDFTDTVFTSGLNQPTCIAWAPDGSNRLFVSLKTSGIGVIENGALRKPLFATFPQLFTNSECGVLGLAFDPDYATNHFVYVFVTVSSSEQRIVRFTDQDSTGTQRTNILTRLPTLGVNHDGGALAFGPDGKLYFAIGDNGAKRGVDNNLTTLAAKVGRTNKDGTVPLDNPFYDGTGPRNDYIWATGFRNPFTMTFRPTTGELWLNVVGSTPDGQTAPSTTVGYEQVFVVHAGDDGGYDDFEGNQPSQPRYQTPFPRPSVRPRIQYPTDYPFSYPGGAIFARSIASFARADGTLTVTTASKHPYRVGEAVEVSNTGVLDGIYTVQSIPADTQFTASAEGSALGGTGGKADVYSQGGCVTGGEFYESSGFPSAYRGNFFYGDYVLSKIMRAQLGSDGRPQQITPFIEKAGNVTDIAVGPDGALYYANINGTIHRVAYTGSPGLVVSPTTLVVPEGGKAAFSVRLGEAPSAPVTVQIHKGGTAAPGTDDLDLAGPPTLTFTLENWATPQSVAVVAALDADTTDDHATFNITAPDLPAVAVAATATDQNLPPLVLSTNSVQVHEGHGVSLTVALSAAPEKSVLVRVRPGSGPRRRATIARGALLRFTPKNWDRPQKIVVVGLQDADKLDHAVTFVARAEGYLEREIAVEVLDNDPSRPIFLSTPPAQAVVGRLYQYLPETRAHPDAVFSFVSAPDGMTVDPASGEIAWMPATLGSFPVSLQAKNRFAAVVQNFTVTVSADAAPAAFIVAPAADAFVTGAQAEFFGGSVDDFGTYKAEFYVDGVLVYTDENRDAHYHLGGAHNLFDTTTLANGPHTLRLVVMDDAGQTGEATVNVTVAN